MSKLDKQFRVRIHTAISEITTVDLSDQPVYLVCADRKLILTNSLNDVKNEICFGMINIDEKLRLVIPEDVRIYLNLKPDDQYIVYYVQGLICIDFML